MQQSIRDRLLVCLKAFVNNNTLLSTTLKIKLTGDGTFIGKHIHVVHLPYLMTADGNHKIAILKVKEDYET